MEKGFADDAPIRERRAPSGAAARFDTRATRSPARALHALHTRPGTHARRRTRCSRTPASVAARHHRRARARVMRARNGLHRSNIERASRRHRKDIAAASKRCDRAKPRRQRSIAATLRQSLRSGRVVRHDPERAHRVLRTRSRAREETRRGGALQVVRPLGGLLQRPCAGTFCCATITRKRPPHAAWREVSQGCGSARASPRRIAARRLRQ